MLDDAQHDRYIGRLEQRERELASAVARAEEGSRAETESGDVGDRAERSYSKETTLRELDRDRHLLDLVRGALDREAAGSYGLCVECAQPIEEKRLEAVPWARHCIGCQEKQDRGLL